MRRSEAVVLGLVLCVATGVRLRGLATPSLWLDELLSLQASVCQPPLAAGVPTGVVLEPPPSLTGLAGACPWSAVWGGLARYAHPPLYFLLLRLWREVFGEGDFAARSLSVVAGVLAVLALFLALQAAAGTRRALWGAALLAVAAPQVLYSQEARGYAWLVALVLGAASALLRIERFGTSRLRLAALGGFSAAALLVHYYAVAPLAAITAYALVRLRGGARRRALLALGAAGLLFAAVWGPNALPRADRVVPPWLVPRLSGPDLGDAARRAAAIPLAQLQSPAPQLDARAPVWPALAYLIPLLALRRRPQLLLFWLWLVCCVGLVTAMDLALGGEQLSWLRYTLSAGPAVCALLALVASERRSARDLVPLAGLLLAASALPRVDHSEKPPFRDVGRLVSIAVQEGEPLLVADPILLLAIDHYAPVRRAPLVLLEGALPEATRQRLSGAGAIWLLSGAGYKGVAEAYVREATLVESVRVGEAATLIRLRLSP